MSHGRVLRGSLRGNFLAQAKVPPQKKLKLESMLWRRVLVFPLMNFTNYTLIHIKKHVDFSHAQKYPLLT